MSAKERHMKVLMIATNLDKGGIGSVVITLYRSLIKAGVDCDLVYYTGSEPTSELQNEIKKNGSRLWEFKNFKTAGLFGYISQVYQLCKKEKYDAVHIHTSLLIWVAALGAKLAGVPIRVGHAHGAKFLNYSQKVLTVLEPTGRFLNRVFCTDFVTCAQVSAQYTFGREAVFIPNYLPEEKILAVQKQEIEKTRKEVNPESKKYLFGYLGSLDGVKHADFLLDVWKELKENSVDAALFLAGNTEREMRFQSRVEELGLDEYVQMLGFRRDASVLIQAADYYVSASETEGMSASMVEAQMAGRPCFASALLPPENDLKVDLFLGIEGYDPKVWAQTIVDALKSGNAPITREEALQRVRDKGVGEDGSVKALLEIYKKAEKCK